MLNIDTSDKKEQRNFGLVMAGAITILGLIRYAIHSFEHVPVYFFVVAAVFGILALAAPKALEPVFILWMKLALVLNWIMTRVMLTFAFYIVLTPTRIFVLLFSEDPLKREFHPEGETYWEEAEDQPDELEAYRNQF